MRSIRLGLVAVLALAFAVPGVGNAAVNLAPNPSFEQSPTDPTGDVSKQPLLPTGWAFEGAAGLFDHSEQSAHSGRRMAAISIPASTPRSFCQQELCAPNPVHIPLDAAARVYTVTPHWRTALPVPVQGSKSYSFSFWHAQTLATVGVGGAVSKIRWVDANGVPISETAGPKHIQTQSDPPETLWGQLTKNVSSPAAARGAIIMLGAADDAFITQVKFDDVNFSAN